MDQQFPTRRSPRARSGAQVDPTPTAAGWARPLPPEAAAPNPWTRRAGESPLRSETMSPAASVLEARGTPATSVPSADPARLPVRPGEVESGATSGTADTVDATIPGVPPVPVLTLPAVAATGEPAASSTGSVSAASTALRPKPGSVAAAPLAPRLNPLPVAPALAPGAGESPVDAVGVPAATPTGVPAATPAGAPAAPPTGVPAAPPTGVPAAPPTGASASASSNAGDAVAVGSEAEDPADAYADACADARTGAGASAPSSGVSSGPGHAGTTAGEQREVAAGSVTTTAEAAHDAVTGATTARVVGKLRAGRARAGRTKAATSEAAAGRASRAERERAAVGLRPDDLLRRATPLAGMVRDLVGFGSRGGRRRWVRGTQALVAAAAVVTLFVGVRTMFVPSPAGSVPYSATFPQALAVSTAERFAEAYYTWDESDTQAHAEGLADVAVAGLPRQAGWDGTGKSEAGSAAALGFSIVDASHALVTVVVPVTEYSGSPGSWREGDTEQRALSVPVQVVGPRTWVSGLRGGGGGGRPGGGGGAPPPPRGPPPPRPSRRTPRRPRRPDRSSRRSSRRWSDPVRCWPGRLPSGHRASTGPSPSSGSGRGPCSGRTTRRRPGRPSCSGRPLAAPRSNSSTAPSSPMTATPGASAR